LTSAFDRLRHRAVIELAEIQIKKPNFPFSPDGSGILFLAFSARKRYSEQQEPCFKKNPKLPLLKTIQSQGIVCFRIPSNSF